MANKKSEKNASIKYSFLKAAIATILVLALFVLINWASMVLTERTLSTLVFSVSLLVVVVLFLATRKPKYLSNLKKHPKQAAFVAVQVLLLAFFALEFFQVLNVSFENHAFWFSSEPMPYILMALIFGTLILINFVLKKKNSLSYEMQKDAKFIIRETSRIILKRSKKNPYNIALLAFEVLYVLLIATGIFYFLDPVKEFTLWGKMEEIGLSLSPEIKLVLALAGFVVITALLIWFHAYATQFNQIEFQGKKGIKKKREKKKN